jgi:hypothetical protein
MGDSAQFAQVCDQLGVTRSRGAVDTSAELGTVPNTDLETRVRSESGPLSGSDEVLGCLAGWKPVAVEAVGDPGWQVHRGD